MAEQRKRKSTKGNRKPEVRVEEGKTELLKEEPKTVSGFRTREDDFVESSFPSQTVGLVALAVLVIVSIICGIKVFGMAAAVVCVIVFIELLMGFLLGNSPAFVSVILVFAMVLLGIWTGMNEAVLIGSAVFLSTILIIKDRK